MTIPDFQTLMLPVLKESAQGEVRVGDIVERLAEHFGLSPEDRSHLLPSGRQTTFANRVHWAKSYLGKAGLVELTRRAHFRITSRGRTVLSQHPEKIDTKYLSRFPEFLATRSRQDADDDQVESATQSSESAASLTPDEIMRAAARQLEAALASELLQRVMAGTPAFFESLVVRLLIGMGYGGSVNDLDRALVGKSGDGGVDGVIDQDPLGLDRIYVQAKRYATDNNIGAAAIRDFFGSLDHFKAAKGLFVTTSSFSSGARQTAEVLSNRIVLIDGQQLARLMIRHEVGCRVEETLTVKKLDEDFFGV